MLTRCQKLALIWFMHFLTRLCPSLAWWKTVNGKWTKCGIHDRPFSMPLARTTGSIIWKFYKDTIYCHHLPRCIHTDPVSWRYTQVSLAKWLQHLHEAHRLPTDNNAKKSASATEWHLSMKGTLQLSILVLLLLPETIQNLQQHFGQLIHWWIYITDKHKTTLQLLTSHRLLSIHRHASSSWLGDVVVRASDSSRDQQAASSSPGNALMGYYLDGWPSVSG